MFNFKSYLDFYAFLQQHEFLAASGSVSEFKQAVENISKGCGCSKTKRILFAKEKYLNLGSNMDDAFKENLKIILEKKQVFFYHEEVFFLEV